MESQRIPLRVAAKVLGLTQNEVRYLMRRDRTLPMEKRALPIGQVYKSKSGNSYRYLVYKELVMKYAGLKEWTGED